MRIFRNRRRWDALRFAANPFRTALACPGIVIGVASVVTLTSLGNGVSNSVSGSDKRTSDPTSSPSTPAGVLRGRRTGRRPTGGCRLDQHPHPAGHRDGGRAPLAWRAASSNVSTGGLVEGQSVQLSGVDPSYENIRDSGPRFGPLHRGQRGGRALGVGRQGLPRRLARRGHRTDHHHRGLRRRGSRDGRGRPGRQRECRPGATKSGGGSSEPAREPRRRGFSGGGAERRAPERRGAMCGEG